MPTTIIAPAATVLLHHIMPSKAVITDVKAVAKLSIMKTIRNVVPAVDGLVFALSGVILVFSTVIFGGVWACLIALSVEYQSWAALNLAVVPAMLATGFGLAVPARLLWEGGR
ncbi:hypothetical protein A6A05_16345 [Magnetospirillum moscoviense]|uniref:Uncharacterized protein n=2 Tax=Magnetospirillum moscoviense TaxID=1437059 RepID=A0A178MBI5_9PROT|nr:hypothetical protein A6A05_16345 [Magnetospirillum moscoviense]